MPDPPRPTVPLADLPRYPRLHLPGPALWRSVGDLQIGLGDDPLVLHDVPPALGQAIALLDGRHSFPQLADQLGNDWAHWLLEALDARNALSEGVERAFPRPVVVVVGSGELAQAIALQLDAEPSGVARTPTRLVDWSNGGIDGIGRSEVVIIAPRTAEADRVCSQQLTRAGRPYLVTRLGYGSATLGPFVVPGVTSCLNCEDLTRCAEEEAWPLLAFQLAQLVPPADPLLTSWLATGAAAELAAWLGGHRPETLGAALTYDRHQARHRWRQTEPQPGCHCAAA